jgi:hypothetical protein
VLASRYARRPDATHSHWLLGSGLLATLACSDPEPIGAEFGGFADEVVLESSHFRFHAHEGDADACDNAPSQLGQHFEAISAYLGLSAPPAPIDYYKFASVEELQSARACSLSGSPACVHGGQVRSAKLFDAHELIHAYVAGSRPPWIFIEGLADALSCGYGPWSRPRDHANFDDVSALAWQDLAAWVPTGDVSDLTFYRAGTQLVRYLIDNFGVERFMQHYRAAPASTVPHEVDEDFAASFDESLEQAWKAALELELPGGPCLTPFECSQEPIELGESWQVKASCGVAYIYKTLQLSEASPLTLAAPGARDMRGERDSLDMLIACDGLWPVPTWTSVYPPRLATRLEAGKYALVLPVPEQSLRAELAAFGMASSCDAALQLPLVIEGETTLAVPRGESTSYVALSAEATLAAELHDTGAASPTRVCRGCALEPDCDELSNGPQALDPLAMPVLEVQAAEPDAAFTLISIRPP